MTITNTLSSPPPPPPLQFTLTPSRQTLYSISTPFLPLNLKTLTPIHLKSTHLPRRTTLTVPKSTGTDSPDGPDRLISALCYFYPFFDGIQYGKYAINQFSFIQTLIQPLVPAIRVYKSVPFNGVLVFLTLYFVVVRNPNFSRYVRFNAMQAVVLDVLLIFPDLLERGFEAKDGVGLGLLMSVDSTVFLFMLVSLVYGSSCCCLGQLPRLPIVAEAADRQVM
ncbi:putative chloroplast protein import component Tic20 [Helianthus debilis subsp. tardiflorus]